MKLVRLVSLVLVLSPAALTAQQDPVERLGAVLPPEVADRVIAVVTEARSHGLPYLPIVNRALEGAAKRRSGDEIAAAAQAMAGDLAAAHAALQSGGRSPDAGETAAGATALQMGVDGKVVSDLASGAPSGRSLAVPLVVIGALIERGLPADAALAVVLARLDARASNVELAGLPGEAGRLIAEGYRPAEVGRALAAVRAGRTIPAGPPPNVPANGGQPGRRPPRRPVPGVP